MNKLTPEAEAMISKIGESGAMSEYDRLLWQVATREALKDTSLLKAQGLYTREEVREMLIDAYKDGSAPPWMNAEDYANLQLNFPTPPKTEV